MVYHDRKIPWYIEVAVQLVLHKLLGHRTFDHLFELTWAAFISSSVSKIVVVGV